MTNFYKLTANVNLTGNPCMMDKIVASDSLENAIKSLESEGYPSCDGKFMPCKVTQSMDVTDLYK